MNNKKTLRTCGKTLCGFIIRYFKDYLGSRKGFQASKFPYTGNDEHNSPMRDLTDEILDSSSGLTMTSSTIDTIYFISSISMPRVVMAGVPILIPLVIIGLLVSNGTIFLLTVIPAFPSAFSAAFP